jgi:GNAT superfamily N-acetyltransferase
MAKSLSATIKGPSGPLNVVFAEATPEQSLPCGEVIVAAFAPSVPASFCAEQEEHLSQHPLSLNQGTRFWCISLADDPSSVLALCKTIRRRFLVRDNESMREEDGYSISTVATHPQYRRLGLATLLIKHVAEWLDGPADAAASMLYTSVGDVRDSLKRTGLILSNCFLLTLLQFYVAQGWQMMPSIISDITNLSGDFQSGDRAGLPSTRLLTNEEIPALCVRDVADLKESFQKSAVGPDEVHLAVLPSAEMITWLHEWGDFISSKFRGGEAPYVHGAICEAADTWIYWHHGAKHLAISRVRTPPGVGQGSPEVLAGLLLDALEEARRWKFPKVIVWEPSPELISAMDLISKKVGVEVETKARPNSITSLRWKNSDKTKKTTIHLNEEYASC